MICPYDHVKCRHKCISDRCKVLGVRYPLPPNAACRTYHKLLAKKSAVER